ncbi:M-phase phosphoprotein 8-like [Aphelenchoides besseyi]|nr:M-phase phosphoprotein 8-like [Aphelenchoides besseyi]
MSSDSPDTKEDSSAKTQSSESDDNIHEIEKIISHRKERGQYRYRIRWVGYDANSDTWEPETHLLGENARQILGDYKKLHGIENAKRSGAKFDFVSSSDEERKADWFVAPNAEQRELRNLFVDDRILTPSERLLSEQCDTGRLTRSQLRDLLPPTRPKSETSRRSRFRSSTKRAKPKTRSQNSKAKRRRAAILSDSSEESSDEEEISDFLSSEEEEEKVPLKAKKVKSRISLDDGDFESTEAKVKPTSSSSFRIPKKSTYPPPASPPQENVETDSTSSKSNSESPTNQPTQTKQPTVQWRPAVEQERDKECRLPGTNYSLTATLNIPPQQLLSYSRLSTDSNEFQDACLASKILIVRAAIRNKANKLELNAIDSTGRTLLHRIAEMSCDQQHTPDEVMDCLVNAGADVNKRDTEHQRTPLHVAVMSRRICHARKLVELCSQINTIDTRGESPLISALRTNNLEMSKLLLCSGAAFQSVFSHPNLSKTQQKPALNYHEALHKSLSKARGCILRGGDFKFHTFSGIFQVPLFEKDEWEFTMPMKCDNHVDENLCGLVLFGLVNATDRSVVSVCWGLTPLVEVELNGKPLEKLQDNNSFVYSMETSQLMSTNKLRITLDSSNTRNSKQILIVQLQGVEPPKSDWAITVNFSP